jgi:hypothetical protein
MPVIEQQIVNRQPHKDSRPVSEGRTHKIATLIDPTSASQGIANARNSQVLQRGPHNHENREPQELMISQTEDWSLQFGKKGLPSTESFESLTQ